MVATVVLVVVVVVVVVVAVAAAVVAYIGEIKLILAQADVKGA